MSPLRRLTGLWATTHVPLAKGDRPLGRGGLCGADARSWNRQDAKSAKGIRNCLRSTTA